jgi:hypothetical protein
MLSERIRNTADKILRRRTASKLGAGAINGVTEQHTEAQYPPRVGRLQNGERTVAGSKFITPDPEAIASAVRQGNGRVNYLATREVPMGSTGVFASATFERGVIEPLCAELMQKYPNKKLALRGIITSVNGTLKDALKVGGVPADVLDIAQTVAQGGEKAAASFNVQGMYADETPFEAGRSLGHVSKYAAATHRTVESRVDDRQQGDAMFPALLVYDASQLVQTGEDRFTVRYVDGADLQQALLGAYVLDRPTDT